MHALNLTISPRNLSRRCTQKPPHIKDALALEALASRTITLYDVPYEVDLQRCRMGMLNRLVELRKAGEEGSGRAMIAKAAGVDVSTVSRFFSGKSLGTESFVDIVTIGLGLELADVIRPLPPVEQKAS